MANVIDQFKEHSWIVNTAQTQDNLYTHRWEDWYRGKETQDSLEREAKKISSIRKQIGWSNRNLMKRIASMPLFLFHILREIDKEMFANTKEGRKRFDRFLIRNPECSVRE